MSTYDQIAQTYERVFGSQNIYYNLVYKREKEIFDNHIPTVNSRAFALDIGCGTGSNTRWLSQNGYFILPLVSIFH